MKSLWKECSIRQKMNFIQRQFYIVSQWHTCPALVGIARLLQQKPAQINCCIAKDTWSLVRCMYLFLPLAQQGSKAAWSSTRGLTNQNDQACMPDINRWIRLKLSESKWVGNLGKYPVTTGIWPGVFMPESLGGLDPSHLTLASRLSKFGYRTGHIGKWHLGVGEHQKYLPTRLSI